MSRSINELEDVLNDRIIWHRKIEDRPRVWPCGRPRGSRAKHGLFNYNALQYARPGEKLCAVCWEGILP